MKDDKILVTRSYMPPFEEYVEEIRSIFDTRFLTNMGEKHRALQTALEAYLDVPHLTLFTNGHLALEGALAALNLPAGGEVITTPFTFASTTHAIVRAGLTPVFCDVNPDNYTIDAGKIEALITDKTCAILPVHVYGYVCDVHAIRRIADAHGLKVVYDAAHTFGETLDDVGVAGFGDLSMLSFHATKVFHTIEGGAVAYHDEAYRGPLDWNKNFGISGPNDYDVIGGNAKMNEFQAAMGLCTLRHVDGLIAQRKTVVERYRQNLSGVPGIHLMGEQPGVRHNYAYLPVIFEGFSCGRDEVQARLAENNVMARRYFYPLTSSFACYRGRFQPGETPVADFMAEHVLTLPLYPDLPLAEVDRICGIILG